MKIALAYSGPLEIELIQVLDGETPHTEFLRERGEGLHHLRFAIVDDLGGMLAELAKEGIEPVFRAQLSWGDFEVEAVYLNTDRIGGVMFELAEARQR